jgi:hypothetical protein
VCTQCHPPRWSCSVSVAQDGDLQGAVSKTTDQLTAVADNLTDAVKQVRGATLLPCLGWLDCSGASQVRTGRDGCF